MNSVVGRTSVLAELIRMRREAAAGGGTFVLLTGDVGIGKSTVLAAVRRAAAADGLPVLAGRCVAEEGVPAFWPIRTLLDRGADLGLAPQLLDLAADAPPATARFVAIDRTARALVAAAA